MKIKHIIETQQLHTVHCSQCGGEFKHKLKTGFSHCENHKGMKNYDLQEQGPAPLSENPLSPTAKFRSLHGNYCGTGNRGGLPTDKLDRACFHHDVAYKKSRDLPDKDAALYARAIADNNFMTRILRIHKDKNFSLSVRFKAKLFAAYFKMKNKNADLATKGHGMEEATGQFSYGAKAPKKGSQRDLTAKANKEYQRKQTPIEPKDQMVGVAKVTKSVAEGIWDRNLGDQLDEKLSNILLRTYHKYKTQDEIIAAALPWARKAAQDLGINPNGTLFQQTWNSVINGYDQEEGVAESNPGVVGPTGQVTGDDNDLTGKEIGALVGTAGGPTGTLIGLAAGALADLALKKGAADKVAEANKAPPEADYGDDYQDMVKRVKHLAGLGPLKTVWDPAKRVYKNIPTAVQPAQQPKK